MCNTKMTKNFYINKDKKTIVANMTEYPSIIDKIYHLPAAHRLAYDNWMETNDDRPTFQGIAKCHSEDEWDRKTGKTLASSRSDLKYHQAIRRDITKIKKQMLLELEYLEKLEERESKIIEKTKTMIDDFKQSK